MSASYQKIDQHIVDLLAKRDSPATKNTIVFVLKRENFNEGKSDRVVAERIYALKREGRIVPIGIAGDTRYTTPEKALGQAHTQPTERVRQVAEGQRRQASDHTTTVVEQTPPAQLGECDLIDLGDTYVLEPIKAEQEQPVTKAQPEPQPQTVVVVPPPPEQPFEGRVDAIAQHIGTTVTLTVRQLITEAIADARATVAAQKEEIATLIAQQKQTLAEYAGQAATIEVLRREIGEQEQLYNELDERYTKLRQKLAALAGD